MRHGRRRAVAACCAALVLWAGSTSEASAAQRYVAMATDGAGAPVRWDCGVRDVHVAGATPLQERLVRLGLFHLSRATGMRWRVAGTADLDLADDRHGGSPVVVAFDDVEGYAALTTLWRDGARWTGGRVVLNTNVTYVGDTATADDRDRLLSLLLHELGHLAGLGHVSDPALVMSDWGSKPHRRYADGDVEGLAAVGCRA